MYRFLDVFHLSRWWSSIRGEPDDSRFLCMLQFPSYIGYVLKTHSFSISVSYIVRYDLIDRASIPLSVAADGIHIHGDGQIWYFVFWV